MIKTQITNNDFLASIAVFAELCNTGNDLKSIVAEFIKSIFALEKKWSMDSFEVMRLLKQHFDFDIPEAVVRTSLNRLSTLGFVRKSHGMYDIIDKDYNPNSLILQLQKQKQKQKSIEDQLIDYCQKLKGRKLTESEKNEIIDAFITYLMEKKLSEEFNAIISTFIIENSKNTAFVSIFNEIKEGLVLITGLKYTSDVESLGHWNDELTVYLDTEHLFNAAGYNGEVYKKLFDDFYSLVNEVNQISLKKMRRRLIHLKYFPTTKSECDNFFHVAGKIVMREDNITPENDAMNEICRGCVHISDVLDKKSKFEDSLKLKLITESEEVEYRNRLEFTMEDKSLIDKYRDVYGDESIVRVLESFTQINYLRRGNNRTQFEKCKHIILTGKRISHELSRDLEIKTEAKDIPFSTDIYFFTNRIWFKLNKGLSKSTRPSTLDIIAKAQIILSSQSSKSVSERYSQLQTEVKQGKRSEQDSQSYYFHLRENAVKPEDITPQNARETLDFIFDSDIEKHLKQKSLMAEEIRKGQEAIQELNKLKSVEHKKKTQTKKTIIRGLYVTIISLIILSSFIIMFALFYLIYFYKTSADTDLDIFGIILTASGAVIEIVSFVKYRVTANNWIKSKLKAYYLVLIQEK